MMFDWDKVHKLLSVIVKVRDYPHLNHIHNTAMAELMEMAAKPVEAEAEPDNKGFYRRRLGDDK